MNITVNMEQLLTDIFCCSRDLEVIKSQTSSPLPRPCCSVLLDLVLISILLHCMGIPKVIPWTPTGSTERVWIGARQSLRHVQFDGNNHIYRILREIVWLSTVCDVDKYLRPGSALGSEFHSKVYKDLYLLAAPALQFNNCIICAC